MKRIHLARHLFNQGRNPVFHPLHGSKRINFLQKVLVLNGNCHICFPLTHPVAFIHTHLYAADPIVGNLLLVFFMGGINEQIPEIPVAILLVFLKNIGEIPLHVVIRSREVLREKYPHREGRFKGRHDLPAGFRK